MRVDRSEFLRLGAASALAGFVGGGGVAVAQVPGRRCRRRATTSATCSGARRRRCSRSRSIAGRSTPGSSRDRVSAGCARPATPTVSIWPSSTPCSARTRRARTTSRSCSRTARSAPSARILAFGQEIEQRVTGVYLDGDRPHERPADAAAARPAARSPTRQHLSHAARARPTTRSPTTGLRTPLRVETAGEWIDRYLVYRRSRPGDRHATSAPRPPADRAGRSRRRAGRADRLRRRLAARGLPGDRPGADLQLRRLQPAADADRARRARRRVRLRQPDRGPGAVPRRPLHAAR